MDDNQVGKTAKAAAKEFMTAGPTLHYSHSNVLRCWLLTLVVYCFGCLLWSRILTGSFISCSLSTVTSLEPWDLGRATVAPISIFEYPWQIIVIGTLMGMLSIVPIVVSQLMSFAWSVPFVVACGLLGGLPGLAVSLVVSCVAVACRPLRFRSRFIAVALCTAPQLLYWGYFGRVDGSEPLEFGFSYAPWVFAWLVGLAMAGVVLGVGHFTRYRPGLVWIVALAALAAAAVEFQTQIGLDELDYRLYVATNDPENTAEFHDHSVTAVLDRTTKNRDRIRYLEFYFYPEEPIALRAALKGEMQEKLVWEQWPAWLEVPAELEFQKKRAQLLEQYDKFIYLRGGSRRTAIALYYKGILSEFSPDIEMLGETEILHFYSDYPQERSRAIWHDLYTHFGDSPESIEARWRIARSWAGQGKFGRAEALLADAGAMAAERLKRIGGRQERREGLLGLFTEPADSVMGELKLTELAGRIDRLRLLIGAENIGNDPNCAKRLATYVMLDPHTAEYPRKLAELLNEADKDDPLYDNILLSQANLVRDEQVRAEKLGQLSEEFEETDGGIEALYELARLKLRQYQHESEQPRRNGYLAQTRETLAMFIEKYPASIFTAQAKKNLAALPVPE